MPLRTGAGDVTDLGRLSSLLVGLCVMEGISTAAGNDLKWPQRAGQQQKLSRADVAVTLHSQTATEEKTGQYFSERNEAKDASRQPADEILLDRQLHFMLPFARNIRLQRRVEKCIVWL